MTKKTRKREQRKLEELMDLYRDRANQASLLNSTRGRIFERYCLGVVEGLNKAWKLLDDPDLTIEDVSG